MPGSTKKDDSKRQPRRKKIEGRVVSKTEEYEVQEMPSLERLVSDGLSIIGSELARYRRKTSKGITLDLKEARVVTSYIEALTKMSKEAREAAKPSLLGEMTDEELLKLVQDSVSENKNKSWFNIMREATF